MDSKRTIDANRSNLWRESMEYDVVIRLAAGLRVCQRPSDWKQLKPRHISRSVEKDRKLGPYSVRPVLGPELTEKAVSGFSRRTALVG